MKKIGIILLIIVGVVVVLGVMLIAGLNKPVILDEQVNNAWAQVDNQLQRRNDLIPNLVSTVRGYMEHERGTFEKITELRSQWAKAVTTQDKIQTANAITDTLSKILLVSENYPELKANENFLTLQAQLEGTENRIAVERMRYNDAVKTFNAYQRTVFGSVFCSLRRLGLPRVYFKAVEGAKEVPKVIFK
ncbi:MAG: LemA family protein [Candidatus Omnitrophica bacterium CG12_big_fil_rev_8_21_14_0_65_42_8]|nr:MAG: LemA family protein [Candidatus Omnitrophica bacterium CG12_big_fil_rev_8_21_14_0_65_42_8]